MKHVVNIKALLPCLVMTYFASTLHKHNTNSVMFKVHLYNVLGITQDCQEIMFRIASNLMHADFNGHHELSHTLAELPYCFR